MTGMTAATSAVRLWAARALFRLRRFDDAGWRARAKAPRCWLRLAQQAIGAVRRPLAGLFVPIMGRVCQRESDNGETGAMVCRRRVTMAGSQQSIALIAAGGEDDRIGPFVRWWPPSPYSGGPGEHKHGSVRPRGRSLRPDGVRTVPTVARTVSRGREGVKNVVFPSSTSSHSKWDAGFCLGFPLA